MAVIGRAAEPRCAFRRGGQPALGEPSPLGRGAASFALSTTSCQDTTSDQGAIRPVHISYATKPFGYNGNVKSRTVAVLFMVLTTSSAMGQTPSRKANYKIYQVGGDVKPPRPISPTVSAPPDSTPTDRQLKVRISFVVAPDGSVADVKLLKRSTPDFDDFAVNQVSKWKFEPATKDGTPVAVRLETEMHSHQ